MGRLAAVASSTVNNLIARGLAFFGDETNGGFALVAFDGGAGPTIIAGTSNFTLTDPGAGGNKWVILASPSGRVLNRYAGTTTLSYLIYGSSLATVV
jgi:hypothetical protein